MKKTTLFAMGIMALLVVGIAFVSATLTTEDNAEDAEPEVIEPAQATCGAGTTCGPGNCNGACGGTCGVRTCGCS